MSEKFDLLLRLDLSFNELFCLVGSETNENIRESSMTAQISNENFHGNPLNSPQIASFQSQNLLNLEFFHKDHFQPSFVIQAFFFSQQKLFNASSPLFFIIFL
jgi:hypothetical protein